MTTPRLPRRTLPNFSGRTLLVIEDSHDSRQLLSDLLRACGAVVVEVDDTRSAKEHVGITQFDMIVTDLALSGEDGRSFLNWLRAQPPERGGRVPAVVVTAFYERYRQADFNGWTAYLQKPIEIGQFVRVVADILHVPTAT
jgi:CheY-like chemotaxis protein